MLKEINLSKLLDIRTGAMKCKEFSKFPSIYKDVAFVLDNNITNKRVLDLIKKLVEDYYLMLK